MGARPRPTAARVPPQRLQFWRLRVSVWGRRGAGGRDGRSCAVLTTSGMADVLNRGDPLLCALLPTYSPQPPPDPPPNTSTTAKTLADLAVLWCPSPSPLRPAPVAVQGSSLFPRPPPNRSVCSCYPGWIASTASCAVPHLLGLSCDASSLLLRCWAPLFCNSWTPVVLAPVTCNPAAAA